MSALTADRNTERRPGDFLSVPMAAATKIYAGGIVAANATGYAVPGSTAATLTALGRSEEQVDNSAGADGDKNVSVQRGVFKFANSAGADEITVAELYKTCYIVDDQTVAKTDGTSTRSAAGKVVGVDADGVWVEIR